MPGSPHAVIDWLERRFRKRWTRGGRHELTGENRGPIEVGARERLMEKLDAIRRQGPRPRNGGKFWWKQLDEWLRVGVTMVKGAMFDEIDEGTAMFKLAPRRADAPVEPAFVTLDADGLTLPSDWYLRLAGAGTKVLRGLHPRTAEIPIRP